MTLVVVKLKEDGVGFLTPLSPAQVTQFGHHEPPLPPLPQVIVHLSRSDLSSTVNKQSFGDGLDVAFFEALVGPNTSLDETHSWLSTNVDMKGSHFMVPFTPALALATLALAAVSMEPK